MNFFEQFEKIKYQDRVETLRCDIFKEDADLDALFKDFKDDNGLIQWKCRGLTYDEMGQINSEVNMAESIAAVLSKIVESTMNADHAALNKAMSEMSGKKKETPASVVRSYATFEMGSVEQFKPRNRQDTVSIANRAPVFFSKVVEKINVLSSMGQAVKKKPKADIENSSGT